MATASKKAKLSSLEEHLLCPVCLTMPRSSPVPACDRGHIVCQECYDKLKVTYDDYPALKKCPTCREPMREGVFSIAGSMIENAHHPCKFTEDGCRTKLMLAEIFDHEENCLHRKIKCPECGEEVLVSKLSSHGRCWNKRKSGKSFVTNNALEDDWFEDAVYNYPVELLLWDNREFYFHVKRMKGEKNKWLFSAAMAANAEERGRYRVDFSLKNPRSKVMEHVTVSQVLPVEAISDNQVVLGSGAFGAVTDKVLEKYIYVDEEGDHVFKLKVQLSKW